MKKIRIHRKKKFYSSGTPLCVKFGDEQEFKLFIGQEKILSVPDKPVPLSIGMFGNALQLHKVRNESVVFPDYQKSDIIDCELNVIPNWVGAITFGLLGPVSKIVVNTNY